MTEGMHSPSTKVECKGAAKRRWREIYDIFVSIITRLKADGGGCTLEERPFVQTVIDVLRNTNGVRFGHRQQAPSSFEKPYDDTAMTCGAIVRMGEKNIFSSGTYRNNPVALLIDLESTTTIIRDAITWEEDPLLKERAGLLLSFLHEIANDPPLEERDYALIRMSR